MGKIAKIINKYVIEFDWLCCAIANNTVERDEFLERKNKLIKKTEQEIFDEIEKIIPRKLEGVSYDWKKGYNLIIDTIKKNLNELRGEK